MPFGSAFVDRRTFTRQFDQRTLKRRGGRCVPIMPEQRQSVRDSERKCFLLV